MATPADMLRELDAKATPAPWYSVGLPWNDGDPWINAGSADPHRFSPVCSMDIQEEEARGAEDGFVSCAVADANTIVALRNALPLLADVLEAADRLRNGAVPRHDSLRYTFGKNDALVYDAALSRLRAALGGDRT